MQTKAQTAIPRWRGFNLLDMFTMRSRGDFPEDDFKWIRDFGFDFVRFPTVYRLWIEDGDDYKINEAMLAKLDRGIELANKYGLHVSLNFHRGPGYSVNREFTEPHNLWKDKSALDAFCFHWQLMAKRYSGISKDKLSFDLINEPPNVGDQMSREDHERVVRTTVAAIRRISPDRLVVADGLSYGREPMPELADLGIAPSTRAYEPMFISHAGASWVNYQDYPAPAWPGHGWDRKRLEEHYAPWADLARKGAGVHCGEGGAFNKTPHPIVLAWLRDVLEILTSYGIGLALWNFRGSFGVMDSGRTDVQYEDFHNHKLDRKLLALLQEFA
ncbi:MAG: endoglucanase [Planctomycetes bacterium RBG_13_60_9]|nr:MAG: endoglucanase [Planctomycetes bacterium RBG_13_60_9]